MVQRDVMTPSLPVEPQVVVDDTLAATTGPHEKAPGVMQHLPPYSVAAVVSIERCFFNSKQVHDTVG